MKFFLNHKSRGIIFLLLALLPYFYISLYTNPIADDFTYAFKGKSFPFLSTWISEYLNWNGRYSSNALVLLNPIAFDNFLVYKISPIIILLLTILAIYYFMRQLTRSAFQRGELLIYVLLLTLLYLNQMPIISEGIYWYTGAVTYQLGNIFSLFSLGLLLQLLNHKFLFKSKVIHWICIIGCCFLTIGFNEITMIFLVFFMLGILAIAFTRKSSIKWELILLVLISFLFGSLVYFAPGNAIRESFFPENHRFFHSVISSLGQCLRFFFEWLSSIPLILTSILYYPINKRLSSEINLFKNSFYITPLISLGLLFFVIFIASFPAYWSTGMLGQHRTINVAYFLFIFLWFLNLTVWYNRQWISLEIKNNYVKMGIQLFIWLSLIFSKNGYQVLDDLRTGSHHQFNSEMEARYSVMKQNQDTLYFEPIQNRPHTLFVLDITENPSDWQNQSYCIYFGMPKKKIFMRRNACKTEEKIME